MLRAISALCLTGAVCTAPQVAEAAEKVIVLGATSDTHRHIRSLFSAWSKQSGIQVEYEPSPDFEKTARARVTGANPPDILLFPQPGLLTEFARRGLLREAPAAGLAGRTHPGLLGLGAVRGKQYGIPLTTNLKSLVWYPKRAFDRAGYRPPKTLAQLTRLTDRIRREQKGAPWCVGIQDSGATGWMATDWIEDLLLSTAGRQVYESWVAGRVRFDSPPVRRAFKTFERLALAPGNAAGGREGILRRTFPEALLPMFDRPPGCWLHKQGSFIVGSFPKGARYGEDYGVSRFPPASGAGRAGPVIGGGDIAALVSDRPAARKVLEYMTTADWFKRSRAHEGGTLSAFTDVRPADYPLPADAEHARILDQASRFLFDGSDRMPAAVGTAAFWTETVDWIAGDRRLGTTLRRIDAAWPGRRP